MLSQYWIMDIICSGLCFLAPSLPLLTFASSSSITDLFLLWSLGVIFSLSGVFLLKCWQDAAFILDFIRSPRSSYICHSQVSHCPLSALWKPSVSLNVRVCVYKPCVHACVLIQPLTGIKMWRLLFLSGVFVVRVIMKSHSCLSVYPYSI